MRAFLAIWFFVGSCLSASESEIPYRMPEIEKMTIQFGINAFQEEHPEDWDTFSQFATYATKLQKKYIYLVAPDPKISGKLIVKKFSDWDDYEKTSYSLQKAYFRAGLQKQYSTALAKGNLSKKGFEGLVLREVARARNSSAETQKINQKLFETMEENQIIFSFEGESAFFVRLNIGAE